MRDIHVHACRDFRDMGKKETALHLVDVILPSYKWIGAYEKKTLQADFIAGLTVGVIIVPQVITRGPFQLFARCGGKGKWTATTSVPPRRVGLFSITSDVGLTLG
jgi:hypothetical protein